MFCNRLKSSNGKREALVEKDGIRFVRYGSNGERKGDHFYPYEAITEITVYANDVDGKVDRHGNRQRAPNTAGYALVSAFFLTASLFGGFIFFMYLHERGELGQFFDVAIPGVVTGLVVVGLLEFFFRRKKTYRVRVRVKGPGITSSDPDAPAGSEVFDLGYTWLSKTEIRGFEETAMEVNHRKGQLAH